MKHTGITRKVDELGRIVLPIELRRTMGIEEKDALEIFVESGRIILSKYDPSDVFTGDTTELIEYMGKRVSKTTIRELARIASIPLGE